MTTIILNWNTTQVQIIQTAPDKVLCYTLTIGALEKMYTKLRAVTKPIRDDATIALFEVTSEQTKELS